MTEYELLDLVTSSEAHMGTQFSLYLTVISAYMIVAYLVGSKLNASQVTIASILMVFGAGGQTWGLYATLGKIQGYFSRKSELAPLSDYELDFAVNTYIWIGIMSAGILASLFFMWQVRQTKVE